MLKYPSLYTLGKKGSTIFYSANTTTTIKNPKEILDVHLDIVRIYAIQKTFYFKICQISKYL